MSNQGDLILVDGKDIALATQYRWCTVPNKSGHRYCRSSSGPGMKVYLHRLLLNAPNGVKVDHKNGNTLDNRRSNLRLVTDGQNCANRRAASCTGYKGVERLPCGRFRARIWTHDHGTSLGYFATAEDAARAYDEAAAERFGAYARLNFPEKRA